MSTQAQHVYSIVIAVQDPPPNPDTPLPPHSSAGPDPGEDWRLGDITVDWVDFTREKSVDHPPSPSPLAMAPEHPSVKKRNAPKPSIPGQSVPSTPSPSPAAKTKKASTSTAGGLSLQPLLGHVPGPNPLDSSVASGVTSVGRGVVHLFRHAPPASLIASLDAHPVGEGSKTRDTSPWAGERAEGEDGSLIAILAVPAWMRPADFLEFIGGWSTCLEGVRMIREATTPNRSIVLLKFRDPLQASDFLVIFTGRAFSSLDTRETCHPIRIHHLVLHRTESSTTKPVAIPAFPPEVYSSRARQLPELLKGVPEGTIYELPSCPVCLERLDSTVTGLVTLPCAHTFDCDCLRKWGDSRCPVCRVSHLLLSSAHDDKTLFGETERGGGEVMRLTKCSMCDSTERNWICVVCGVVGCGRYEPGKGHARRHWEESGHVLAMELETQRVWDYKGDNYVHRLIQTRTDGKLVELPSASSLVTPSTTPSRPLPLGSDGARARVHSSRAQDSGYGHGGGGEPDSGSGSEAAGPSSKDVDKISTIEAITLEYSYLLSSQLEAMRQHYESESSSLRAQAGGMADLVRRVEAAEARADEAARMALRAEKRAEKASELAKGLQGQLASEKALSRGLSDKVRALEGDKIRLEGEVQSKEEERKGMEETVRDLMFNFEAQAKIQSLGGEGGAGGDVILAPAPARTGQAKGKTKRK